MSRRWNMWGLVILLLAASASGAASADLPVSAVADSLMRAIHAAGDSTTWAGADAVVVWDRTDVRVEPSGLGHVHRDRLVRVLTEAGARQLATQRFDYDPASNFIRIEQVRVIRADGRIELVDPALSVDLPAPAEMIYWGARMKILSLPRLNVGDAVETRTYKKGFQIAYLDGGPEEDERYIPPMRGHFYDVVTFQESVPLKEKTYRLRVPRDKPVQFGVYNGSLRSSLTFTDSSFVYTWEAHDVAALKSEPRMPDDTDVLTKVVLATVESWPAKSRWFFQVNDPVFDADEGIRTKVRELTAGLKTDDEKMAALLHWVAQEIRYSGLSMGKGEGYTLHPGTMTFEERCGVCKDIAGMLVTMLRAAGYTTYPVMTDAGARVEAIPADQFNHCVVAVERPDGSFTMLDPTWAPFDRATWSHYEGEQNYVIGSPRGEGLSRIRTFTAAENRLTIDDKVTVATDGTIEGDLTLTGIGASDARIRGGLSDAPAGDREAYLSGLFSELGPGLEITSFDLVEPRDFGQDARIRMHYRVPRYAAAGDSLIGIVPPALRIASRNGRLVRLLALTKPDGERQHEALLWFTQEVVARDTISLPPGFRATGSPDSLTVSRDAAGMRGRTTPSGGKILAEVTATLSKRTIPAAEWSGGAEAADSLRAFGQRTIWAGRGR
jgi:transglutaminase-like putative cysteine protease